MADEELSTGESGTAERAIVERIMTQHWDLKACDCWVCDEGREAGCRPRDRYLRHKGDPRPSVKVEDEFFRYEAVLKRAERRVP